MNTKILVWAAIIIVIVVPLIVLFWFTKLGSHAPEPQPGQAELNATGPCRSRPAVLPGQNYNITTCNVGERFEGFKLLNISESTAQILVYDDCGACMHNSTNGNLFVEVVNISVGQSFGSACEGIDPSKLLSISTVNDSITFESNMSAEMLCM